MNSKLSSNRINSPNCSNKISILWYIHRKGHKIDWKQFCMPIDLIRALGPACLFCFSTEHGPISNYRGHKSRLLSSKDAKSCWFNWNKERSIGDNVFQCVMKYFSSYRIQSKQWKPIAFFFFLTPHIKSLTQHWARQPCVPMDSIMP